MCYGEQLSALRIFCPARALIINKSSSIIIMEIIETSWEWDVPATNKTEITSEELTFPEFDDEDDMFDESGTRKDVSTWEAAIGASLGLIGFTGSGVGLVAAMLEG